jgi:proteasome accessory factor B
MAGRMEERLLNLTIALLSATRFMTKEEIFRKVPGYTHDNESNEAIDRKFERDKDDLREMGINIQVGPSDMWANVDDGYRIFPDDYYLPEIDLTGEESRIVALATSIVAEPLIEVGVQQALAKLRAVGAQAIKDHRSYMSAHLKTEGPNFAALHNAILTRTPVSFTYRDKQRTVHCWKITQRSGFSYVLGTELGVGPRTFKITRIQSEVTPSGSPGSFDPPSVREIADLTSSLEGPEPTQTLRVAIRENTAGQLRHRGKVLDDPAPDGYEVVEIAYGREDEIVSSICEAGPHALVMDPGEVRDHVIAQLTSVAGGQHE